ncbi:ATP-binding protein [bacterium]|nr:ATP-binding protein [bacterium]
MYPRVIQDFLDKNSKDYPVIAITGPRQSGKSTLCKMHFKDFPLISLEDPDTRSFAKEDPRGFLKTHPSPVIFDEVQRVPELLSYIQTLVDENPKNKYILTGSNHLALMESITQSLAGRALVTELLPFSLSEISSHKKIDSVENALFNGGYPKIHAQNINATTWLAQYYRTYVEKDVRQVLNISDLDQFDRFVRLCAGRVGQLLNLSSLGNDCGISSPSAQKWLSVLKSTYIAFTLQPYFNNFSKRHIKTPKLYFYDTGLLCFLLRIQSSDDLMTHPFRGAIFENWIVVELIKSYFNKGSEAPLYFWRDQKGHEIDVIIDKGQIIELIEAKSSHTFDPSFLKDIQFYNQHFGKKKALPGKILYAGSEELTFKDYGIHNGLKWAKEL